MTTYTDQINGVGGDPSASDAITGGGQGLAFKAPVRVATTANIALSGLQTIDGVVLAAQDRVLVKDQTLPVDNGIWIVSTGSWSRATDMDSNRDLTKGTRVAVTDGTVNAGSVWVVSSANPVAVGTDDITLIADPSANAAGAVMNSDTSTAAMQFVIDEDDMASDLDTKVPTQQSVKAYVDDATEASPIVILSTGQSNDALRETLTDVFIPDNIRIWDWDGLVDNDAAVGSAWLVPTANEISGALSFAIHTALANPLRMVYVFQFGYGGIAIDHWQAGASSPDMRQVIEDNVAAGLALLSGVDKIDVARWWQGESDADTPSTYIADFADVLTWLRTMTWFPRETPVIVHGVSSLYSANQADFNRYLAACAAAEPDFLRYVHTAALPSSFWFPPNNIHVTAEGLYAAGRMAWEAWEHGQGRAIVPSFTVDPDSGNIRFGSGIPGNTTRVFEVYRDSAAAVELGVNNQSADAAARSKLALDVLGGSLVATAYPTAFAGGAIGEISWSGAVGLQFTVTTGFIRYLINSVQLSVITSTGMLLGGPAGTTAARQLHSRPHDAVTNVVTHAARLTHSTTGTAAVGFGVGLEWELENASGTNKIVATEEVVYTDATNASEDADRVWSLMVGGAAVAEKLRLKSTGELNLATGGTIAVNGTAVLGARKTGWAAATGTATRSTFATGSVTLPQLAERVKALIDDLISHGAIGA